jgi:putative nucleotidyltransferase with HDIG domain
MREAIQFLHSMAHALSAMTLYTPKHPSVKTAVDTAFGNLQTAREAAGGELVFSFLPDAVVCGHLPLHELHRWPWAARLSEIGVQRLELSGSATRDSLAGFLDDVNAMLMGATLSAEAGGVRRGIRWGLLAVQAEAEAAGVRSEDVPRDRVPYRLGEEVDIVRWLYQGAGEHDTISRDEVEAVVNSLTVGMADAGQFLLPLLQASGPDDWRTVHALNVSILSMSLAEALGLGSHDIHAVGIAGLMHDIGLSKVDPAILAQVQLGKDDRRIVEQHPIVGARMLMKRNGEFDLAAIVAYEHHMRPNGTGYPRQRFPRELHYVSRIVSVCDVYDALRTPRPHRPAWEPAEALRYLEDGVDTIFDGGIARAFIALLRRVEPALAMPPAA